MPLSLSLSLSRPNAIGKCVLCLLLVLVRAEASTRVASAIEHVDEREGEGEGEEALAGNTGHQWALQVDGDLNICTEVANSHGLDCVRPVGSLDRLYLVRSRRLSKRAATNTTEMLQKDSRIGLVLQQKKIRRFKRDFVGDGDDESGQSEWKFSDPLFDSQWYVTGGARNNHTLNVIPAWRRGYTGKGVVVAILDDGLEHSHPDLHGNYDRVASGDFVDHDDDPTPLPTGKDGHGTKCAGVVAAIANNSYCGVGLAYEAKVGGLRVPFDETTDAIEASAISYKNQHIDIYSGSWGPADDGTAVEGPGELTQRAFVEGVTNGRRGRGSIYIWASGNGGQFDSCSCDGYASSIFTISISSTDFNNTAPRYGEQCPSTLLSTYSSGAVPGRAISTADIGGNCTSSFGATSAAAPLAAAIYALVLEANPNLSWRDAQFIGILAADDRPFLDAAWQVNGIGRRYSLKYGFGLMDAASMIRLAELWTTVPPQHVCSTPLTAEWSVIPRGFWRMNISFDGCETSPNRVRFIEHVVITISLTAPRRGNVNILLISPNGTRSRLLNFRPRDNAANFDNWPFMSVQFWGENPAGNWSLEILNRNANQSQLIAWQLTVYGTDQAPIKLSDFKRSAQLLQTKHRLSVNQNVNLIVSERVDQILTLHSAQYERYRGPCDSECSNLCYGPTRFDCHQCKHFEVIQDVRECVAQCPVCFYAALSESNVSSVCLPCAASCPVTAASFTKAQGFPIGAAIALIGCAILASVIATTVWIYLRRRRSLPHLTRMLSEDHLVQLLEPCEVDAEHPASHDNVQLYPTFTVMHEDITSVDS